MKDIIKYKSNRNIVYSCKYHTCNAKHQRDVNAAINIKRVGASTLTGEVVRATLVA